MKIFFILQTIFVISVKINDANGASVSQNPLTKTFKFNPACKQLKCPSVSEPLCVRLKIITSASESKSIYVEMINRCEMKYVICYQGVEAVELPMSYCDHGKNITSDMKKLKAKFKESGYISPKKQADRLHFLKKNIKKLTSNETSISETERKRNKREAGYNKEEKKDKKQANKKFVKSELFPKKHLRSKDKIKPKKSHIQRQGEEKKPYKIYMKDGEKDKSDKKGKDSDREGDSDTLPYVESKTKNKNKNKKFSNLDKDSEEDEGERDIPGKSKNNGQNNDNKGDDDGRDDDEEDVKSNEKLKGVMSDREEYQINSEEKLHPEKVDMEQYNEDCPKTCPARAVMLCGRCKDGIYRTFLSVCHMRMFDCHHPDEKVALISRQACAMSGPYLQDLRVPQGMVHEPHDEDVVLRFLKCKDYSSKKLKPWSKLNCNFDGNSRKE